MLPKAIVATTYTLEVLQVVRSTRDAFRNFGTGWGNMADLDTVGWLWFSVPVMTGISKSTIFMRTASLILGIIVGCVVHLFYAWRVHLLGRNWWITGFVIMVRLPFMYSSSTLCAEF